MFCRNGKLLTKIFCYPLCELGGKPAQDGVGSAIWVSHPLWLGVISTRDKTLMWIGHRFVGGSFEKVNIQAFLTTMVIS